MAPMHESMFQILGQSAVDWINHGKHLLLQGGVVFNSMMSFSRPAFASLAAACEHYLFQTTPVKWALMRSRVSTSTNQDRFTCLSNFPMECQLVQLSKPLIQVTDAKGSFLAKLSMNNLLVVGLIVFALTHNELYTLNLYMSGLDVTAPQDGLESTVTALQILELQ